MNPLNFLRRRRTSLQAQALAAIVAPDPAPEYSGADRADGLPRRVADSAPGSTMTHDERVTLMARLDQLAAPLAVDTDLLRDAICDGDNPALRSEVFVTAAGSMLHGSLTGGAA